MVGFFECLGNVYAYMLFYENAGQIAPTLIKIAPINEFNEEINLIIESSQ